MDEPSADRDLGEAVYSVGRFQPPTIGHAAMIRALIATGKPAFVFVSSSTEPKASNPLESKDKVAHLRKMFPSGVTFVDTKADCPDAPCGGPIGGYRYLVKAGYTKLTLVGGSDREKTFGPDAPLWKNIRENRPVKPPAFQALARNATDASASLAEATMSGTKARRFVVAGDRASFRAAVKEGTVTDADADWLFDRVKEGLDAAASASAAAAAASAPSVSPARTPKRRLEGPVDAPALVPAAPERVGMQTRSKVRKTVGAGVGEDVVEDPNISMFPADDEPTGGRRRKTRRRKGVYATRKKSRK